MERIKPQNKKQVPQKVTPAEGVALVEGATHDETGKFAPGTLGSVGGVGKVGGRRLTQRLISFLHEEVREGKGKNAVKFMRVTRCLESLYRIATSERVAPETRLDTLKFMFAQVDGPLPKAVLPGDDGGGQQGNTGPFHFTLRTGNQNADGSREAVELHVRQGPNQFMDAAADHESGEPG